MNISDEAAETARVAVNAKGEWVGYCFVCGYYQAGGKRDMARWADEHNRAKHRDYRPAGSRGMNISDEAVEAAYRALPYTVFPHLTEDDLRLALEAAAPHLMAAAWEEGVEVYPLCYAAVACGACPACMGPDPVNPYRNEAGE